MSGSGGFDVSRSHNRDGVGTRRRVGRQQNQRPQSRIPNHHHHQVQVQPMPVPHADNQTHSRRPQSRVPIHHHQVQVQPMAVPHTDNQTHSGAGSSSAKFTSELQWTSSFPPPNSVSNLDSFLNSVTPVVSARRSSEVNFSTDASGEAAYYCIGDLWQAFRNWSAYGVGVPFRLYGIYPTTQFYVPYIAGMQLYIDPKKAGCQANENDVEFLGQDLGTGLVLGESVDAPSLTDQKQKQVLSDTDSRGHLAFQFIEQAHPHYRKPLFEKASALTSQDPKLSKYRSCDLLPSSWISVAWYPIYRIPTGPKLIDLKARFLTLHSLSTQPGSSSECSGKNGEGALDPSPKVRLPVIGLASLEMDESIINPTDPEECSKERALLEAANNWLYNLRVFLPEHQFYLGKYQFFK